MPQKFVENKVDRKTGKVIPCYDGEKPRRTVSIEQMDADELNADWQRTGTRYDLVKEEKKAKSEGETGDEEGRVPTEKEYRATMFQKLADAGVKTRPNMKTDELEALVKNLQPKAE